MVKLESAGIKAIIFDLGGVVIGSNLFHQDEFIAQHLEIPVAMVKATWKSSVKELMRGQIDESHFWKKYASSHSKPLPTNWNELWTSFYKKQTPINEDLLSFVNDLQKAGYRTPVLSDTIPSHDQINQDRGVYKIFFPIFLSFKTGLMKDDERAFLNLLSYLKLKPFECIFVDDLISNVELSKKVGIFGLLFTDLNHLRGDLLQIIESL